MDKEIRSLVGEIRSCGEGKKKIEGRAIPFGVFSPNREGFQEIVMPDAINGVLERSDIFMLYNHSKEKGFMARSKKGKGSLAVEVREDGVYFSFEVGEDKLSRDVYEKVCRGDLDETSWAFSVAEDSWEKQEDGSYIRTITKFDKIYDFSIVDQSYYGIDGVVGCKRFAELQEEDRKAFEEAKAEEERKEKEKALADYYTKLKEEYNNYIIKEKENEN